MYHLSDWKAATKWTSLIVCTLLLLSLPLYLNDTEAFAPIKNAAGRIGNSSDPIQIQTLLVGFIATVATGVLCYKKFNLTETSVFCNVALVQIISISATVIIRAIIDWDIEAKDLITFDYAAFVIPFFTFVFVSKVHSYGDHTYIRLSGHHPRQH